MIKTYNKLVRDRIPEIIEASGKTCVTEILSDEDYLHMVDAKLDEELAEYHKDQNIEELADLMEVIHAAAVARGYTLEELEAMKQAAARPTMEEWMDRMEQRLTALGTRIEAALERMMMNMKGGETDGENHADAQQL